MKENVPDGSLPHDLHFAQYMGPHAKANLTSLINKMLTL